MSKKWKWFSTILVIALIGLSMVMTLVNPRREFNETHEPAFQIDEPTLLHTDLVGGLLGSSLLIFLTELIFPRPASSSRLSLIVKRFLLAGIFASVPLVGLTFSIYLDPHFGSIPQYAYPKLVGITFVTTFVLIYAFYKFRAIASLMLGPATRSKIAFYAATVLAGLSALAAALNNYRMFERTAAMTAALHGDAFVLLAIALLVLFMRQV